MAGPEVTGRKVIAGPTFAAFTIAEFCRAHRISQSMYFKMRNTGLGPREMRVGARVLISLESAERWRRERESTTNTSQSGSSDLGSKGKVAERFPERATVFADRNPEAAEKFEWSTINPGRPAGARIDHDYEEAIE
jgi:hypothetical protein